MTDANATMGVKVRTAIPHCQSDIVPELSDGKFSM